MNDELIKLGQNIALLQVKIKLLNRLNAEITFELIEEIINDAKKELGI